MDNFVISEASTASNKDVEQHLEMGNKMLAAGQLADALSHYHAAVGKFMKTDETHNFQNMRFASMYNGTARNKLFSRRRL